MSGIWGGNEAELIERTAQPVSGQPSKIAEPHEAVVMVSHLAAIERELRRIRSFTPEYGRQFLRSDGGQCDGTGAFVFLAEGPKSGNDWYVERLAVSLNEIKAQTSEAQGSTAATPPAGTQIATLGVLPAGAYTVTAAVWQSGTPDGNLLNGQIVARAVSAGIVPSTNVPQPVTFQIIADGVNAVTLQVGASAGGAAAIYNGYIEATANYADQAGVILYEGPVADESRFIDSVEPTVLQGGAANAPGRAVLDGHGGPAYFIYGGGPVAIKVSGAVAASAVNYRLQGREILSHADPAMRAQYGD